MELTSGGGANTYQAVLADMNRDGKPDLVVANSDNTVSIFPNQIVSSTDVATFGAPISIFTSTGTAISSVSVGDVDGDGFLDIATVNAGVNIVSVYRNTTTTPGSAPSFAAAVTAVVADLSFAVSIGDLNGDGKPDLVLASTRPSDNISVLRNESTIGAISFATRQLFSAGTSPSALAIGDLDQDGQADIVVPNGGSNDVSIFRNISSVFSISLTAPTTLAAGTKPFAVAIVDFDGDAKLDIATANDDSGTVSVFQNTSTSGTISFAAKADFSTGTGSGPYGIAIGDTDGDGKPDIATANFDNSTVSLFRNTSTTGTLSFTTNLDVSSASLASPYGISIGDLNADGKPDIVLTTGGTSNNVAILEQKLSQSILITSASTTAVGTLSVTLVRSVSPTFGGSLSYSLALGSGSATVDASGNLTAISVGTVTLTVGAAGDTDYSAASATQVITIGQASQTLTITSANTMNVDGTLSATVITTATGGRGGAITFAITSGTGLATVDPTTGLITAISSGTVNLTASAAGDTDYSAASTTQMITIGQASQTLTITSANTMNVDGTLSATVITTATGGRGGAITFAITSGTGLATVDPTTGLITAISSGTVNLTASAAGDTDYSAASTTQVITIGKSTPMLTITSSNMMLVLESLTATISTTATYGRGGAITFAIFAGSGSATVNPTTGFVTAIGAGTVILTASSSGDSNYNMSITSQLITINKISLTLTITSSNVMVVDGTLAVTANTTASGGGTLTYVLTSGSGFALVTPTGLITAVQAGTITLTVNSAANSRYNAATVSQLITINKGTPTLTITSSNTIPVFGSLTATVNTTATYGRGGVISFAIIAGSGSATVNSTTGFITAIQSGTITLTATSAGDVDYNMASASQLITIGKGTPTLAITSANVMIVDGSLTVSLSTTAVGLKFNYSIGNGDTGSAAVNSTGVVRAIQAGAVLLRVTSIANTNYYASAMVTQTITISKTTPTLMITSANMLNVGGALTASISTSATYGRGGDLVFVVSAGSGSATVNPNTGLLRGISGGTITLTVTAMGDIDYNPATTSQVITVVGMSTQTLTILSANTMRVDGTLLASVTSTAANGGAIRYSVSNGTGVVVVNSTTGLLTAIQAGNVTLIVSTLGNVNYGPATTTLAIAIGKATPMLTVTSANTMVVNTNLMAAVHTTATFGRGGVITYAINAGSGLAAVNPSTGLITAIGAGTVTLIVTSAGDVNYNSATVSQVITITTVLLAAKDDSSKDVFVGDDRVSDQRILASKAVSPNGDGFDDTFVIQNIENYPNNEVVIANRNGEAVFKAQGYNNDQIVFAGVSNSGAELLDGIYYYTIVFYDQGKMNRLVGYFKLRR